MTSDALTLFELNSRIREIIKSGTEKTYWVIGEISELKVNYSGHCYLELIQKDQDSDQVMARSRATIWAQTYRLIKPYFETSTGQSLAEGIGILVKVSVEFHEVFGLSLNILDIEPTYTVGELALRKQKVIDRLTAEGVITMNRDLEFPILCRKIAIISSETAAGYGDFRDQLLNNTYGYKFYCKLFPSIMQGDETEQSIIRALEKINSYADFFDVVVIIRGGGSQADLSCFNNYWLAYHITQFPLPVLTGIGHEQDDSVVDLVAHIRLKTPTAVAAFFIEHFTINESAVNSIAVKMADETRSILKIKRNNLLLNIRNFQLRSKENLSKDFSDLALFIQLLLSRIHKTMHAVRQGIDRRQLVIEHNARKQIERQTLWINTFFYKLQREVCSNTMQLKKDLNSANNQLRVLDPKNVLIRGYSITFKNGIPLKEVENLIEGDTIESLLHKGKIFSTIKKLTP
jgi:exodeoxyribonuclease VII large subunit